MLRKALSSFCIALALSGCQAESLVLPGSEKLSIDKVARIAETINKNYPKLSSEIRQQLLNTVVQSIDNMVFVEGGTFQMGDFGWPVDDDPHNLCDWPCGVGRDQMAHITMDGDDDFVHPVKLSSYYFSKYQTTLGDFDLFFIVDGRPQFDAEFRERKELDHLYHPKLPAHTQSWQQAKDYCGWLKELSGYAVDLPTEAQWEYAARSRGRYVAFSTDNGSLDYDRNFPHPNVGNTFFVDSFVPSPLGIYNLSGNATDWVNDWYDKNYYHVSPFENPQGPATGTERVWRGSNFMEGPVLTASTMRRWGVKPVQKDHYSGVSFRCSIQSAEPL